MWKALVLGVAAVSVAQLDTGSSAAPVTREHRVEYYAVRGTTLEELTRSLDRSGPIVENGLRSHGRTEWSVDWRYQPWKRKADCKLLYIRTTVHTMVTLPKWADRDSAPPDLVDLWDKFIAVLEDHEGGHVENARAAADSIAAALRELPPQATCGAAARAADKLALDILFDYRARDLKYDRDTRHGQKQLDAILSSGG